MKGIVFTEFLELVENKFGIETVDEIIELSNLESGGIYTSVGTYNFSEMLQLVSHLSGITKLSVNELLYTYGVHFFSVIEKIHGNILNQYNDPVELLSSIENHIHVHVRKIYPDAELPYFEISKEKENKLTMIYYSERAMYTFAKALIEKSFSHYKKEASINIIKIKENGTEVKFEIQLNG